MSGLRERWSRAYVDASERGPRHPALYPVLTAAGLFVLGLVIGAGGNDVAVGAGVGAGAVAYWLPSLIGWGRQRRSLGQVIVVNLFLGWTFVGWVLALVMAFGSRRGER